MAAEELPEELPDKLDVPLDALVELAIESWRLEHWLAGLPPEKSLRSCDTSRAACKSF
jgi:hypothetical protein